MDFSLLFLNSLFPQLPSGDKWQVSLWTSRTHPVILLPSSLWPWDGLGLPQNCLRFWMLFRTSVREGTVVPEFGGFWSSGTQVVVVVLKTGYVRESIWFSNEPKAEEARSRIILLGQREKNCLLSPENIGFCDAIKVSVFTCHPVLSFGGSVQSNKEAVTVQPKSDRNTVGLHLTHCLH